MYSEIRKAINKLLWDRSANKNGEIIYINRTRPGLILEVAPITEITDAAKDYFRVGTGISAKYIPYHRVVEIKYSGGVLWKSRRWKIPR
ncbi:MAG: RNA repair domain-containing protein [Thermoprotei archaeon]